MTLTASSELRLQLSNLAHSLATRHSEASYFRPQYYAALCSGLSEIQYLDLKQVALGEVIDAVEHHCRESVPLGLLELFWTAFGSERIDRSTNLLGRSRAAKAFGDLVSVPGLPNGVVKKATALAASESPPFATRMLALPAQTFSGRLGKNPLTSLASVVALAEWKAGITSSDVALLQGWLTNAIHCQVKYRFVIGVSDGVESDDVAQEVLTGVLQRLFVYQPERTAGLERWLFGTIVLDTRMAVRNGSRQFSRIHQADNTGIWFTNPVSAEDAAADARAELAEYTVTKINALGERPNMAARVDAFVDSLGILLGVGAPKTEEELAGHLRSLFPQIDDIQVARILAHGHFNQSKERKK